MIINANSLLTTLIQPHSREAGYQVVENWNNVIDFRTLDAEARTMSGITILSLQLTR